MRFATALVAKNKWQLTAAQHFCGYANAATALRSDRARALMIDLAEWIAIGEWRARVEGEDIRELLARAFAD
jgi:hypothetical protein